MANSIVVLAGTGERVICDLQEVREGDKEDGKPICLIMIRPYTLQLEPADPSAPGGQEVQVRFNKWLPYSTDTQFKIPFSALTCVGAVDPGLESLCADRCSSSCCRTSTSRSICSCSSRDWFRSFRGGA